MSDSMTDVTAPGPRKFRGIVLLAALVALAGAGAAIWTSTKDDVTRALAGSRKSPAARPAAEPKKPVAAVAVPPARPIGDDEPAFWSDLALYKAGPGRPRPILVVKRGKQPSEKDHPGFYMGLLARELVRQGLLFSAREELGALTRDVPIGDPEVSGTPDVTFRIGSRFRTAYQAGPADPAVGRVTIVQGSGESRRVVWAGEFDCRMIISPDYPFLVAIVERFSRGEFRKALEDLGLSRTGPAPPSNAAEGELPPGIEERLGSLVETEAFAAIRALHEAIRSRGETSTLLIALARAYANLGSLSESQWTADYLAFQARGLLYAQRAVVRDHDAPASLRGQAYVEALAGLHQQALHDLNMANKADGGKSNPAWAPMIRAYSRSNAGTLGKLAEERPDDPLPRYLRFLTLLRSSGHFFGRDKVCRNEIIAAGRAVLEKVPDCFRVHGGMATAEGVANLHTSTTVPYALYAEAIPRRVGAIPGLPRTAAERIAGGVLDEVGLRERLAAAAVDDPDDLTWGVLARQLREIRYFQVCYRIHFLAYSLATDFTGFAAEALPLISDHPNRAYIECAAEGFGEPDTPRKLRSLDLADFQLKENDMMVFLRRLVPDLARTLEMIGWEHTSLGTVPGQTDRTKQSKDESRAKEAHNLLRFDPESPLGRAALIESNWPEARPNVAAWEKDHGGDTIVLAQLGLHALGEGKLDDAGRLLEVALARSPDRWIFDGLAEVYRKSGRVDRWKKAVDAFLKGEDQHLDHAHAAADLANALMEKGLYDQAWPYAERAARSWAGWAMPVAARCAEKRNDWKAAELWVSRTSRRYPVSWLDWFYWCKRTGQGDARSAAELVESQVEAGRRFSSPQEGFQVAILYLLDDQPEVARRHLEERFEEENDTAVGACLAWACDLAGDVKARDAMMKAVATRPNPSGPKTARLIGVLADWLAKGERSQPDFQRIDAILEEMNPTGRPTSGAIVGLLLDRHGHRDEAARHLKQCDSDACAPWIRLLVRDARRARGVELAPVPW